MGWAWLTLGVARVTGPGWQARRPQLLAAGEPDHALQLRMAEREGEVIAHLRTHHASHLMDTYYQAVGRVPPPPPPSGRGSTAAKQITTRGSSMMQPPPPPPTAAGAKSARRVAELDVVATGVEGRPVVRPFASARQGGHTSVVRIRPGWTKPEVRDAAALDGVWCHADMDCGVAANCVGRIGHEPAGLPWVGGCASKSGSAPSSKGHSTDERRMEEQGRACGNLTCIR